MIGSHWVKSDRLWKSSALTSLFYEVDHAVIGEERIDGKERMGTIASSTSVNLAPDDRVLRLVGGGKKNRTCSDRVRQGLLTHSVLQ